jgi:hypothetical protein
VRHPAPAHVRVPKKACSDRFDALTAAYDPKKTLASDNFSGFESQSSRLDKSGHVSQTCETQHASASDDHRLPRHNWDDSRVGGVTIHRPVITLFSIWSQAAVPWVGLASQARSRT